MTLAGPWLVTGGAGFIGSNLVATLLANGEQVVVLDDLSTGTYANVERFVVLGGMRFRFIEGSILDRDALAAAVKDVSVVVNLAAQVSVLRSIENPTETLTVNAEGFRRVLQAAAESGVRRILYASSAAIYGDNPDQPLAEEAIPRPLSPYAESKVANEQDAGKFAHAHPGAVVAGFRFFNIYGPNQRLGGGYASVIPAWLHAMAENRPPVIYGNGLQTRDFCHVDDVITALRRVGGGGLARGAHVFNVGSGCSITLLELLEVMTGLHATAGMPVPLPIFKPSRAHDIRHSACSIDRARSNFGFVSTVELRDGLRSLVSARSAVSQINN